MPRDNIVLQCGDCKSRNYTTTKNKKTTPDRLEFTKFCRRCRKHTAHKETKKGKKRGVPRSLPGAPARRRERKPAKSSDGENFVGRTTHFLRDTRAEMRRVSWPGAKEVQNTTRSE